MMQNSVNPKGCATWLEKINFKDISLIVLLSILAIVNVTVIIGNCLVIAAVYCFIKLHSVTNLFIVSLAVADLLVGIVVLPFSAMWEVFKVWIFGDIWCQIWLAVDVWTCTASILNLCIISLDRYLAVTRPILYPNIMSHFKAKVLIVAIWVLSFVICFPPLIGWKDSKNRIDTTEHSTECSWKCELTSEAGYVVYSALGSFYIPTLVMIFFYWKIYQAAVNTSTAIKRGFKVAKGPRRLGSRLEHHRLTLRIHRGRSSLENKYSSEVNGNNNSPSKGKTKYKFHTPRSRNKKSPAENVSAVKRFQLETKAAKTLGIIVGGFILCWFPFFTVYLIRAFCRSCIHPLVFSILFWMGYCNSAINPLIYALFSKDFRFAFKRIICWCRNKKYVKGSTIMLLQRHRLSGKNSPTEDNSIPAGNASESR